MNIIEMNADHVVQIAELEKICFSDSWSENSIASELNSRLSDWLVVTEGEQVVAYVGSQTVIDSSDMMNIAVHPDFRRKGIALALIETLETCLRSRGSKMLLLEVRDSNAPAITLYEKLGFTQVGLRKNYYRNPKEDARILRKEL